MTDIQKILFSLADREYKDFASKLMPTVDPKTVLGVRTPALRKLAKELKGTKLASVFLKELPHTYYEEKNLHGFLIESIQDYEEAVDELDAFLPFVDNWATCDMVAPKALIRQPEKLLLKIQEWMASPHPYTLRYGIGMLMRHFLDERFEPRLLETVAVVQSEEYYVNMMIAWYFATALAKQPEATLPYFTGQKLHPWIHNKAIQKACESRRISQTLKEELRSFRISPDGSKGHSYNFRNDPSQTGFY